MELNEATHLYLPKTVSWQRGENHVVLDPEFPHWVAVDSRGARILGWLREGLAFGPIQRAYAALFGVALPKAWLHVHDFLQALLRVGFACERPRVAERYRGRAAYARPSNLKELWFHTNNICNLACAHCLVSSAPWVQDWGLPTERFLRIVDEAAALGADRFYFTGGEPFMRKDIFQLIRYLTESKGCELILLTNATLFQGERAGALKELNRDRVRFQVSLDGARPATHDAIRGRGTFQKAVEGLERLKALGFQTSITTAVAESNLEELAEITGLADRLGVETQHLMWLHKRGRLVSGTRRRRVPDTDLNGARWFPSTQQLIDALRAVKAEAHRLGVAVDNFESIQRRVNGRPGVKYDLGNACWDSLCIYSDGAVYPSAALANLKPLRLGRVQEQTLRKIWERSPLAEAFRRASVVGKTDLADDPFRYLTGGGDIEHTFWFNLNGEMGAEMLSPERLLQILSGPDPYYPIYRAMMEEAIWEIAEEKGRAVNRKSGYDAPHLLHAMGQGAIHCATDDLAVTGEVDVRALHSNCVLAFDVDKPRKLVRAFYAKAAEAPQAELCCPTEFDPASIAHIPKEVIDRFYGCGSPVTMAGLREGGRCWTWAPGPGSTASLPPNRSAKEAG